MTAIFRRNLADYVEYHRDPNNCAMHVFGIIVLFLAAVLPLSLWPVTVLGLQANVAVFVVLPVLAYWLLLDAALGLAIVGAAVALLLVAAAISSQTSETAVWVTSIVLGVFGLAAQIVGHKVFENRALALADNPAHLLMGPMFVMAKLFIALGFRADLAAVIREGSPSVSNRQSFYQGDAQQDS